MDASFINRQVGASEAINADVGNRLVLGIVRVVLDLAEAIDPRSAADARLLDFTNPVGIVMQALLDTGHRAIGRRNSAMGFQRMVARLVDLAPGDVLLEHVGLNHLPWERAARVAGEDRLPALLRDRADEIGGEIGSPAALIRLLGAIPSS